MKNVISTFRGNLIVANEGPHYMPGGEFVKFVDSLIRWLRHWQDTAPACQAKSRAGITECLLACMVVWKTSVPGHPNCKEFSQPSSNVTEMEALVANPMPYDNNAEYKRYGWWAMKHHNRIVEQRFAERNLTYAIMDAYALRILRPDQHFSERHDCVHNKEMTKRLVLGQMLLHLLKAWGRSMEMFKYSSVYARFLQGCGLIVCWAPVMFTGYVALNNSTVINVLTCLPMV